MKEFFWKTYLVLLGVSTIVITFVPGGIFSSYPRKFISSYKSEAGHFCAVCFEPAETQRQSIFKKKFLPLSKEIYVCKKHETDNSPYMVWWGTSRFIATVMMLVIIVFLGGILFHILPQAIEQPRVQVEYNYVRLLHIGFLTFMLYPLLF